MPELIIDWQQVQDVAGSLIVDHWLKIVCGVLLAFGGTLLARWKQRRDYYKREFLQRLNLSLNYIEDGVLRIRTIFEMNLGEVLFNQELVNQVLKAAKDKTVLLKMDKDTQWLVNNSILNEIAERFSEGQIAHERGMPVCIAKYAFCLTCEKDDDVRVRKLRVMLVQESMMDRLLNGKPPQYERPYHNVRWNTLRDMAKAWSGKGNQVATMDISIKN